MISVKETPPRHFITPQGFAKLREEYEKLSLDERPKLLEVIAWAAANGDRSENADYIYGKKRLREIDRRLGFLKKRIDAATIVDPASVKSTDIKFGATVTVTTENGDIKTYCLVGEDEIDVALGKISLASPIGKALLSKVVGDEVIIHRPKDVLILTVEKIEYIEIK